MQESLLWVKLTHRLCSQSMNYYYYKYITNDKSTIHNKPAVSL